MVWKIKKYIVSMVSCCVMLLAYTTDTFGYTPYDGNISTTYITIFEDIASKISPDQDYVFFRSEQYEYVMLVGDMDFDGTKFTSTATSLTEYKIKTNSGYSSSYIYTCSTVTPTDITITEDLVYSNLGYFPSFEEKGENISYATFIAIVVIGICMLLRPIFNFVCRSRNGN